MRLATWNINSLTVRLPQVLAWLDANPVDVLVLQETKVVDEKFPRDPFAEAGWQVHAFGQKTYNGVALLARSEATDVARNIPDFDDAQARVIAASVDGMRVIGAYFPNGQAPDSDKFVYKMRWLDALREWLRSELTRHPHLVLMGDYNIAPEDRDVYDPIAWAGQIMCTPQERAQFRKLVDELSLADAFRLFDQPPRTWSWWDYRQLAFQKGRGLRIDHILVSAAVTPRVVACHIDKQPRKNKQPSDHAPVVVEIAT